MKYISLQAAKKILWSDDDAAVTELVTEAELLVEASLGRSLEKRTYTRYIDGNGSKTLILEVEPASVESVRVGGYEHRVHAIDWLCVELARIVPKWRKNVEITYTAGFEVVPQDFCIFFSKFLREICVQEEAIKALPAGVKSQKIGDLSVVYLSPAELISVGMGASLETPSMRAIFQKYKVFPLSATL